MFGEYAQIATYLQQNQNGVPYTPTAKECLPSYLCPTYNVPQLWNGGRDKRNAFEDFIMIAEFSELEGPKPVMTIPKHGGAHFDQNAFAVKILAVDHQTSSDGFTITEDAQVLISDLELGVFAFVHHLILYDNTARGFVRPYCITYITMEPRKLTHFYEEISLQFKKAARYLKYGNKILFVGDLERHLKDLEHTKGYLLNQVSKLRLKDDSNEIQMNDARKNAENEMYRTLQTIRQSSTEIKEIVSILKPLLSDRRLEALFRELEDKAFQQKQQSGEDKLSLQDNWFNDLSSLEELDVRYGSLNEPKISPLTLFKPREYKPLLVETKKAKRFNAPLRGLHELCSWGAKEGLRKLRHIHEHFKKDYMVLELERNESRLLRPRCTALSNAHCVTGNFLSDVYIKTLQNTVDKDLESWSLYCGQQWGSSESLSSLDSFKSADDGSPLSLNTFNSAESANSSPAYDISLLAETEYYPDIDQSNCEGNWQDSDSVATPVKISLKTNLSILSICKPSDLDYTDSKTGISIQEEPESESSVENLELNTSVRNSVGIDLGQGCMESSAVMYSTQELRLTSPPGGNTQELRLTSPGENTQELRLTSPPGENTQEIRLTSPPGENTQELRLTSSPGENTQELRLTSPPGENTQTKYNISRPSDKTVIAVNTIEIANNVQCLSECLVTKNSSELLQYDQSINVLNIHTPTVLTVGCSSHSTSSDQHVVQKLSDAVCQRPDEEVELRESSSIPSDGQETKRDSKSKLSSMLNEENTPIEGTKISLTLEYFNAQSFDDIVQGPPTPSSDIYHTPSECGSCLFLKPPNGVILNHQLAGDRLGIGLDCAIKSSLEDEDYLARCRAESDISSAFTEVSIRELFPYLDNSSDILKFSQFQTGRDMCDGAKGSRFCEDIESCESSTAIWKPRCRLYTVGDWINNSSSGKPGSCILEVLTSYQNLHHIIFSLLTGRPVLVVASGKFEQEVVKLVRALTVFVPVTKRKRQSVVLEWTTKPLSIVDVTRLKLVGVCRPDKRSLESFIPCAIKKASSIVDLEKRLIKAPTYQGMFINVLMAKRKLFKTDVQYLSYIQWWLTELTAKAYLFFHSFCLGSSGSILYSHSARDQHDSYSTTVSSIMTKLAVQDWDCDIIQYFTELVKLSKIESKIWQGAESGSVVRPFHIQHTVCQTYRC